MWFSYIGGLFSKLAAKPMLIAGGAAVAFVLTLIVALTVANNRLDAARAELVLAQRDRLECIEANESNQATIARLVAESNRNRSQRDAALRRQQELVARLTEMEQEQDEQTAKTIERIIRVADGDLCADTAVPVRLRNAFNGSAD